jgi:hypothetical protein
MIDQDSITLGSKRLVLRWHGPIGLIKAPNINVFQQEPDCSSKPKCVCMKIRCTKISLLRIFLFHVQFGHVTVYPPRLDTPK